MHQSKSNDHVQTFLNLFCVYYQVMQPKSKIILHTTNSQCFFQSAKTKKYIFVTIFLFFEEK
jgi:hypothetical protein